MKKCTVCEKEFLDEAVFCIYCGSKLKLVSSGYMKITPPDIRQTIDGEMVGIPEMMGYVTDEKGKKHEVLKGEPKHDSLTPDQLERISCLRDVLQDAYPMTLEGWIDGFICEPNPESEIRLIEAAAVVYQQLTDHSILDKNQKEILYGVMIFMSFGKPHIYKVRDKIPAGLPDV